MSEPEANTVTVPALALEGLRPLYAVHKAAQREYVLVLRATVATLGLDPLSEFQFNIDTGVITLPAPKPEKAK